MIRLVEYRFGSAVSRPCLDLYLERAEADRLGLMGRDYKGVGMRQLIDRKFGNRIEKIEAILDQN